MHGLNSSDPGMTIDWGKTSLDYSKYRPGPPISFYERLQKLNVGNKGQLILDLGTGTGVLARQFAKQGCEVIGTDISPEQIKMALELAKMENLKIDFQAVGTEEITFSNKKFDIITANQCFLYFDKVKVVPLIKKLLKTNGIFMTSHFSWLPLQDKVAYASEQLILKHNPNWTAHSFKGEIPATPYKLENDFTVKESFYYDEPIKPKSSRCQFNPIFSFPNHPFDFSFNPISGKKIQTELCFPFLLSS